jgi:hypothetical protein
MKNKEFGTDQAFAIPSYRDTDPGSYNITNNKVGGLSKREYAAIHKINEANDQQILAMMSDELATELLKQQTKC